MMVCDGSFAPLSQPIRGPHATGCCQQLLGPSFGADPDHRHRNHVNEFDADGAGNVRRVPTRCRPDPTAPTPTD